MTRDFMSFTETKAGFRDTNNWIQKTKTILVGSYTLSLLCLGVL